jgi:hypothetical protein
MLLTVLNPLISKLKVLTHTTTQMRMVCIWIFSRANLLAVVGTEAAGKMA